MSPNLAGLPPRFLRTPEAARFLGLSGRTLEKHRTYGTGPVYRKVGGRVLYAIRDLEAWTEIGARTSFGAFTVAAGYTTLFDVWTISGHYDGGAWGAGAIVAANSVATNWALSGNVQVLGGNLYGYVGRVFTANAYGLSFGYDLGGGATLTAGAERVGNLTMGSLGVAFTF